MADNTDHVIAGSETVARTMMGAAGTGCKITGLALSGTTTLYFTNALTSTGVATIEYLPQLVAKDSTVSFLSHMSSRATLGWGSIMWLTIALAAGIVIRKLGTVVSEEDTISKVETFLYGNRRPKRQ